MSKCNTTMQSLECRLNSMVFMQITQEERTSKTNLTRNEAPSSKIMLEKKNKGLESHKKGQTNTPTSVGLYPHEIMRATKYIQRDSNSCGCYPKDIIRVQWFSRVTNHINAYLRDPKRVEEEENKPQELMKLVHYENAA
ncbi:stress-induced-phosphoprotein 1 [Striga asiatica]|uniref:Stress-induced-phosphoprotein 1 n=1 Tax=Striga asiatica TaxID=4170 RepID=A0A5A7R735_STRAF|nr:stress-induced-phosphoprotein 1 [Striga asiatica]